MLSLETGFNAAWLAWKFGLGEAEVAYWHSLDTGFASRQPL